MSDAQAELLSPIDAATLWPQLHRLGTEVAAVRLGESLLVRAGVAATGLTRLPRMPRTILLGIRKRLGYRGVLVARELAGGQSWEVVSLRLHREKDDGSVQTLLDEAAREIARRGGRVTLPANAGRVTPPSRGDAGGIRGVHERTALRATAWRQQSRRRRPVSGGEGK